MSLTGVRPCEALTVHEYTHEHGTTETGVNSTGVPIKYIRNLSLKATMYTINMMAGLAACHLANRPYMALALTCLEPELYDRCSFVRENFCKQLTSSHGG